MGDEVTPNRRDLIKKGVVAGGLVWAAPTLASTATAQTGGTPTPTSFCRGCAADQPCSGQGECTNPSLSCSCLPTAAGGCFCHQSSSCSLLSTCTSDADCPSQWSCAASCCSSTPTQYFCHPPCGTSAGRGTGPMSMA